MQIYTYLNSISNLSLLKKTTRYCLYSILDANIEILTLIFFSLSFMAATQDIVVDGWVLTMFSK